MIKWESLLGEKMEVDWWTAREIFARLRKNHYLIAEYSDLVDAKDK